MDRYLPSWEPPAFSGFQLILGGAEPSADPECRTHRSGSRGVAWEQAAYGDASQQGPQATTPLCFGRQDEVCRALPLVASARQPLGATGPDRPRSRRGHPPPRRQSCSRQCRCWLPRTIFADSRGDPHAYYCWSPTVTYSLIRNEHRHQESPPMNAVWSQRSLLRG